MGGPYCKTCRHFAPTPNAHTAGECHDPAKRIYAGGNRAHEPPEVWASYECSEHQAATPAAASMPAAEALRVTGAGRDAEHPACVVVYLSRTPTDDELRRIHDAARAFANPLIAFATTPRPPSPRPTERN